MNDEKRLLLIGGGGHCKSILDCVLSMGVYREIGIIDNNPLASALGIRVIGNDDDLPQLKKKGWAYAFISVGSVGCTDLRHKLYRMINETGFTVPTIVDPSAIVAKDTEIGKGVFIGKRVVVNTGVRIGKCAILNTGSIIEHDCVIGDFTHVSPGATLCGQVSVGADSHIGADSVVRQCIKIGRKTVIGIGSVVVKDIPDNVKAYGNPGRVVE